MRDQPGANEAFGRGFDFLEVICQDDAACLAATTAVYLGFDDPAFTAELPGGGNCFLFRAGGLTAWNGDTVSGKELLGLIFV
jgi:hypothetical protein